MKLSSTYAGFRKLTQNASWKLVAFAVIAFLFASMQAFGQGQAGTILGTVTDSSGAVLPNVSVTITNTATGVTKTSVTNEAGVYTFPGIQIGTYEVKAVAQGFKTEQRHGVVVNATDRVRSDFQMAVGAVGETISVEATALAVQTDSGEQSSLINSKQITELAAKRNQYIKEESAKKGLTGDKAFETAVRESVVKQAEKQGFTFEEK